MATALHDFTACCGWGYSWYSNVCVCVHCWGARTSVWVFNYNWTRAIAVMSIRWNEYDEIQRYTDLVSRRRQVERNFDIFVELFDIFVTRSCGSSAKPSWTQDKMRHFFCIVPLTQIKSFMLRSRCITMREKNAKLVQEKRKKTSVNRPSMANARVGQKKSVLLDFLYHLRSQAHPYSITLVSNLIQ